MADSADTIDYEKLANDAKSDLELKEAEAKTLVKEWEEAQKVHETTLQIAQLDLKIRALEGDRVKQIKAADEELAKARADHRAKQEAYDVASQKTDPAVDVKFREAAEEARKKAEKAKNDAKVAGAAVTQISDTFDKAMETKAKADQEQQEAEKAANEKDDAAKKVSEAQAKKTDKDNDATAEAKRAVEDAAAELAKSEAHAAFLKAQAELDFARARSEVRNRQLELRGSLQPRAKRA
ncbi:hypothetical protein WME99_12600 [Sorangium sp. So ce136]|uniref:hypothetical protein n=1 Tax=Sorangium sp. So ce136 TaxID=3133284 RepID=UPI003F101C06